MRLVGRKYSFTAAVVCSLTLSGPVAAASLSGTVGTVTKPVTTALGGLTGGGSGGGDSGSSASGLPGLPGATSFTGSDGGSGGNGNGSGLAFAPGGDSASNGGFYFRAAASGDLGYNLTVTKKLLTW